MTLKQRILYIHGFNSSPQSHKAQLTKDYLEAHYPRVGFHCPQVASSPNAAIEQFEAILAKYPMDSWAVIGSSLGGFFASYLAEKYRIPAVLINPAVTPYLSLADYVGTQINPYTQEVYQVELAHMHDLKLLAQEKLREKNYLVMVQTGDEVLDYRQAEKKYQRCQLIVQQGGDHSFVNFEQMLPTITDFLRLI